jgi:hypothetical protein
MNEIKTENPRIINEHQWRTINKSDGGQETILQVLTLGGELSSIAKQMLAIGWQLWMDENNRLI